MLIAYSIKLETFSRFSYNNTSDVEYIRDSLRYGNYVSPFAKNFLRPCLLDVKMNETLRHKCDDIQILFHTLLH